MIDKKRLSLFIYALLSLLVFSNLNAQTLEPVQSRYVGDVEICNECSIGDGILHFRLVEDEVFTDAQNNEKFRFEVQVRAALEDISYLSGDVYIAYSTGAFGENLDSSKCSISDEGSVFAGRNNLTLSTTSTNLIKISAAAVPGAPFAIATSETSDDYLSYATLECEIADKSVDAGLALDAETYKSNMILDGDSTTKTVFALADNDLRGYRLDGKVWVKDYVPFSNGRGVRIEFSGDFGERHDMTTAHFVFMDTSASITELSVGSFEAGRHMNVEFDGPVNSGILRFAVAGTPALQRLADGGFVAELRYDASAPIVTAIVEEDTGQEDTGRIVLTFDRAINAESIRQENICISLADFQVAAELYPCVGPLGISPRHYFAVNRGDVSAPVVSPISVTSLSSRAADTLELEFDSSGLDLLVVNHNNELRMTVEFLRNAILGTNLKPVEDYQVFVKENPVIFPLDNNVGAPLHVVGKILPSDSADEYKAEFEITVDEIVNGLEDLSSYGLVRVHSDGSTGRVEGASSRITDTNETVGTVTRYDNTLTVTTNTNVTVNGQRFSVGVSSPTTGTTTVGLQGQNDITIPIGSIITITTQSVLVDNEGTRDTVVYITVGVPRQVQVTSTATSVTLEYDNITVPAEDLRATIGFALVLGNENALRDNDNFRPVKRTSDFLEFVGSGFLLTNSQGSVARIKNMECSGTFPYIDQRELFLRIHPAGSFNHAGFTINGNPIDENQVMLVKEPDFDGIFGIDFVVKVTLDDEIDSYSNLVEYVSLSSVGTSSAMCDTDVVLDSDGDGVPDIIDAQPYDADVATRNSSLTTPILEPAPEETASYYSRGIVIRSIMEGGEFTLIDPDRLQKPMRQTRTQRAISAAEYFGIVGTANTRVFRNEGRCEEILSGVYDLDLNLNSVLTEFCVDVTDRFFNEIAGSTRYVWIKVNDEGVLISEAAYYEVTVVPEINFEGQSSYFNGTLDGNNPSLDISASTVEGRDIPDSLAPEEIFVDILLEDGGDRFESAPHSVVLVDDGNGIARVRNRISIIGLRSASEIEAGDTFTIWIEGQEDFQNLYHLPSEPQPGGHSIGYANIIGNNSIVTVKYAEADQSVNTIRDITLYEYRPIRQDPDQIVTGVDNINQTVAVTPGRNYYARVTFTGSADDSQITVSSPGPNMGYELTALPTTHTAALQSAIEQLNPADPDNTGLLRDTSFLFRVTANPPDTITVGWDRIGGLENVKATYLVDSASYFGADSDDDRIADDIERSLDEDGNDINLGYVNQGTRLYVSAGDDSESLNANSYLRTADSMPLYVSDAGLILAIRKGGEFRDYSAANIDYSSIGLTTKELLGYDETNFTETVPVETVVTFGVKGVSYLISSEGDPMGGLSYATFPVESELQDETLYVSGYNQELKNWQYFEKNSGDSGEETWYAIDWPNDQPCPADIEQYRLLDRSLDDETGGFNANSYNCIMVVTADGGIYDDGRDGRVSGQFAIGMQQFVVEESIQCSAFYPNIGQTELFFRVVSDSPDVDPSRLTLMQNGNSINPRQTTSGRIDDTSFGYVYVLKATLRSAITSNANITASYESMQCTSVASLEANADGDRLTLRDGTTVALLDIADNAPFDSSDSSLNPSLTSPGELPDDILTTRYFSRDTLVRSLLREESFNYVEEVNGELMPKTFLGSAAMSEAEYFGVDGGARVFRVSAASDCKAILDNAGRYNLTGVRVREFCREEVTGQIADEEAGSTNEYAWLELSGGRLASKAQTFRVHILPEVNFIAQQSNLYPIPRTKTVMVERDAGNSRVHVRRGTSQPATISSFTNNKANYDLQSGNAGETVTYWLSGGMVWSPTGELVPVRGGHPSIVGNFMYAAGPNNHIDIGVAAADEEVSHIRQVLLYERNGSQINRVPSMVAGESYYVVAEYVTNIPSNERGITPSPTTSTAVINLIRNAGHLKESTNDIAVIEISVDGETPDGSIFTTGWDRIGELSDIEVIYRVTSTRPSIHRNYMDSDDDRIPNAIDSSDGDATALPVDINDRTRQSVDILQTNMDYPLFVTDVGLAIALAKGANQETDYSAANIGYSGLDDDTKESLEFFTPNAQIETIATFGVEVDFEIGDEGQKKGGIAYITFPVQSALNGTLYLGKYDKQKNNWARFDRRIVGFEDTWYAIERTDTSEACPTDIQIYKDNHSIIGTDGLGFAANRQSCIMVAITDGGPYDSSGLDGRIIDPLSIGTHLFQANENVEAINPTNPVDPVDPEPPTSGGSSGGGGAIGVSDILLFVGALLLLMVAAGRRQRRRGTA